MNKIKLGLIQWYIKEFGSCFIFVMFFCYSTNSFAATKTSVANGNWSSAATWSPSGVPASGDDVVISGNYIVTIDGEFTCNNLDIGDATNKNTTLQITSGSNS